MIQVTPEQVTVEQLSMAFGAFHVAGEWSVKAGGHQLSRVGADFQNYPDGLLIFPRRSDAELVADEVRAGYYFVRAAAGPVRIAR